MSNAITLRQKLRKENTNFTQQDIAKMIGVSKQFISQYENCKTKSDKLDIIYFGFRNEKSDKKIIQFLKERNKNGN